MGQSEILLEIHAGEGGDDSKLFIRDMLAMYSKFARNKGLKIELLSEDSGYLSAKVSGEGAYEYFSQEPGNHSVQRVPPTERSGRMQTSTISVVVLPIAKRTKAILNENEIRFDYTRGQGPGGQNRHNTDSAVRATHISSGLSVFICNERSQHQNKRLAIEILGARLEEMESQREQELGSSSRLSQIGNRKRGDKIRTYNFKKSRVVNHLTGAKTSRINDVMNGNLDLILET